MASTYVYIDDGMEQCTDGPIINGFTCPSGSRCVWLAGQTTVLCCPVSSTSRCQHIEPITCNVSAQNPMIHETTPIKTTIFDISLPKCGTRCCPFGYQCQDSTRTCLKLPNQSKRPCPARTDDGRSIMNTTLGSDRTTMTGVSSAIIVTIQPGPTSLATTSLATTSLTTTSLTTTSLTTTSLTTSSTTPDSQADTSPGPPSLTHVIVLAIALSFTLTILLATMIFLVWKRRVGKARHDEMIVESLNDIPHCRSPRLRNTQARFDKAELDTGSCELRPSLSAKDGVRANRSPAELPATPVSRRMEAALGKKMRWF